MKVSSTTELLPGALFEKGKELLETSIEDALELIQSAADKALEIRNYELAAEILVHKASTLRRQGKIFACIESLNKAYRISTRHLSGNKILASEVFREFGSAYVDGLKDYATGLDYFYRALSLNPNGKDPKLFISMDSKSYAH